MIWIERVANASFMFRSPQALAEELARAPSSDVLRGAKFIVRVVAASLSVPLDSTTREWLRED